jgi:PmbA protein
MTERLIDDLTAALNRKLGAPLASGMRLDGWRFDLHRMTQTEIGLKNSRIGGPYTAPSYKEEIGGEVFLHWADDKYSSGRLDRLVLEKFEENWELWQRTAYRDENGPELVAPYQPPEVPVLDDAVKDVVAGHSSLPFDILRNAVNELQGRWNAHKIDGRFKASLDQRAIRNSLGMAVDYDQSSVSLFIEADDLFGDAFAEKRLPTTEEVEHIKAYIGETLGPLKKEIPLAKEGRMPILLPPSVMDAFLEHYLNANLQGNLVANRQSAFRPEDFHQHKQVLRDDLTITVDGTQPLRQTSYRCTGEGVPTGKIDLIANGRLQTPVLNLKYAKRLNMLATPIPIGGGLFLKAPMAAAVEDLYKAAGDCLIVHSILGLHTQDFSSGDFSLTADQCLWVSGGVIQGKVKAVIAGNFFQALNARDTKFAYSPWDDNPACLLLADVSR